MTLTMSRTLRRRSGYAAAGLLAVTTALLLAGPQLRAQAASLPDKSEGIMCETPDTDAAGGNPTFNLDAKTGYVLTPDGNSVYMWGYTATGRSFQLPGPTLCVGSGQKVTVVLHNTLREETSIVFAGQSGVLADGKPTQPQFTNGVLTSLVDVAKKNGTVTYQFTAGSPGTYLYSSGTDVLKQKEMGLYGALVVRPMAGGALDASHDGPDPKFAFDPTTEYLYVLSQIDPDLHSAVELNKTYNYNNSKPRYFFINGRSMPDTLAPNNAAWLPAQPYGALVHIHPTKAGSSPALVRYVNAGTVNYPFHPHGSSQRIIVRDGTPVTDGTRDASYLKFLVDVGPGQSADALESWSNEYDPDTNAIPPDVQLPQVQDQIVGPGETWFSENPYLGAPGGQGPIPNGMVQNNECGEFYHVAHSHALYQATNFGASFGGMMTLIRIDPPTPNTCAGQ